MADLCPTCIFRPGNLMKLQPGRFQGMVRDSLAADAAITCHSTLYDQTRQEAVCRGFWDRYKTASLTLRLALMLGNVTEV